MSNGPSRAAFWKAFICERCQFPYPDKLRAQLEGAEFSDFCACGCNSFAVSVTASASRSPLVPSGRGGAIFEADFYLKGNRDKTIEIIIFADKYGNISYVEVDCCANSEPIPNQIEVDEPPFFVNANQPLLP